MKKYLGVVLSAFLLASCMSKEQLADMVLGSWEGAGEKVKWCIEYTDVPYAETGESTVLLYRQLDNDDGGFRHELREGFWLTRRGMRLFQNVAVTYNSAGALIPAANRKGNRHRLLVLDIDDRQFSFVPEESDIAPRVNNRVDSCEDYRAGFEQYLARLRAKPAE